MSPEETQAALEKAQADLTAATEAITAMKADNETLAAKVAELEKAADGEPAKTEIDKGELPAAVREALEKAEQERDALAKRAEEAEKIAKAEREERLTRDFIAKAETFKALPVKPAEFGPVLKAASEKLTSDEYGALETLLKAADAQIAETDLFKEQGRSREGQPTDALAEAQAKAEEIRKAEPGLSPEQALAKAMQSDRALQERYAAEMRGR